MRVLVIGATGAIGAPLVRQMVERGHEVTGTFVSPGGAERVRAMGARPVQLDALDARAVRAAVLAAEPEAIVHQATALTGLRSLRNVDRVFSRTNRLRTEGTDALLAAAWEAGVRRFVAQGNTTMYARVGGPVKTEEDPLETSPPKRARESAAAIRHLESAVLGAGGIVLRYGTFYGAAEDDLVKAVRRRLFPVIGEGGGIVSWIHLDDAAAATVLALEGGAPGVYNVVDDEPAPMRDWLPALADVLGAPPPRRVPRGLARLLAGEFVVSLSTRARGASNAKAKRELGWTLRHPSWREGFADAYGAAGAGAAGREAHPAAAAPAR